MMARCKFKQRRRLLERSKRLKRSLQRRHQCLRPIELAIRNRSARIVAVQFACLARSVFAAHGIRPSAPGRGRGPRRIAVQRARLPRADASNLIAIHPAHRMFQQRQQRHRFPAVQGSSLLRAARTTRRACRPVHRRPRSSTGTFQRASAASTRCANARSGARSDAAVRFSLSGVPSLTASRSAKCNGEARFLLRSWRLRSVSRPASAACFCASKYGIRFNRACQLSVASAGRIASDVIASRVRAAMRVAQARSTASRIDLQGVAGRRLHRILRMA